jgi:hypothetical protein
MVVRAKFKVHSKLQKGPDDFEVTLFPVTGGSPENDAFYKFTPGGKVEISTVTERVADAFKVGKEYYADFTPAAE